MRAILFCFLLISPLTTHADDSWNQFRGNRGDGIATATNVPTAWNDQSDIRWKTPVPGVAWSSPVFEDGLIWMTSAEVKTLDEVEVARIKEQEYADHMVKDALVIVGSVQFRAVAVDAESGALVHDIPLFTIDRPAPVHSLNSYASPTPIVSGGRLFCHFGSFGTVCLDTQSQAELWKIQIDHVESVGPGSSPVLDQGRLIIPCDGTDDQFVVAIDAATGDEMWRTERPRMEGNEREFHKAFSTPILIEHEGRRQAVIVGAQWVCGYDPSSGKELWRIRHGQGFSMSPRPVYGHGLVYICTAYQGVGLLAIDPSGSGNVTDSHIRWNYESQVPAMPSPILVGNELYFVSERGIATCLDAFTGERHWRERLGGNFCASPICAGGNLYFGGREGEVHVVEASPQFKVVSVNDLGETIMASPAVYENDLLIRTEGHLYRIGG